MISEQEVKDSIINNIAALEALTWTTFGDHTLKGDHPKYTLFLNNEGQLEVYKAGYALIKVTSDVLKQLYTQQVALAKERDLEELAECFRPAPAPAGLDELLTDDAWCKALEKRHMSDWSDADLAKYKRLTGQDGE